MVEKEAEANRRQRQMAFDIFLKIDGIKGESNDAQHREEIEPASFSWGVSQQGTASTGGGAGAGKASFQELHVVMTVSRASPQLFLACAEGRLIKTAVLTCRKAGGRDQRDFLRYTLSDVLVSSYQTNGQAEDGLPVDQLSFTYAQVKVEYWPQKVDGSLGAPVTAGWDLKTNRPLEYNERWKTSSLTLAPDSRRWHHGSRRRGAHEGGSMASPEENKQTVLAYYNLAFNDRKPAEAVERYGGPHYIQHNPHVPDGFEAFIQFVEGFVGQFPQLSHDIKRTVAEGDMVVTHSLIKTSPEDRGTAAADFFRLEEGKIVEHWDVVQPVPESAANDHPMF